MKLTIIPRKDDITHVALAGRLDVTAADDVSTQFHSVIAARGKPAIVDLTDLEFIASLGIGALMECAWVLRGKGQKMVLMNPQERVERTLRVVSVETVVPITASLDEAVAALR